VREDILHFVWKYKKIPTVDLLSTKVESIRIVDVGTYNHHTGPDFFNAKIAIDDQLWAGNVEIHVNSSDWYVHKHEEDPNYDNVILHVVWEDDVPVFRKDGSEIPTLELRQYVSDNLLSSYKKLLHLSNTKFINCEKELKNINPFVIDNWLERLYFERLEKKSAQIQALLKKSNNDWERTLFIALLKNFGLKINGDSFLSLANNLDFSIVRKLHHDVFQLESVLYGMTRLLNDETIVDTYFLNLEKEYCYLQKKFDMDASAVLKPEFFKLRPSNFPTIRLSQLANLYAKENNLFDKVVRSKNLTELYDLFDVSASSYWNNHFTFGKPSKKSTKKLSKKFIDLLIINTILPIKFCHTQKSGKYINEEIVSIISGLKAEANTIIFKYKENGLAATNAKDSQAMLQLYNEYCSKNKCLQCAIGGTLLNGIT
jgi:hypothetical protein